MQPPKAFWTLGCCLLAACSGDVMDAATDDPAYDASRPELQEDVGDVAPADVGSIQAELDAMTPDEQATAASMTIVQISGVPIPPLVLVVAPGGNDQNDGSDQQPLATVMGAQARLEALYPSSPLDRDVEIQIVPGHYDAQEVRWAFLSSGHAITLMPKGFIAGMRADQVKALGGRPIFDGQKACETKAAGADCKFFLVDQPQNSGPTRLRFYYLDIRNYATTGIGLHNSGEGLNLIYGCRFANIGTRPPSFRKLLHGMAAVGLSNSDHNVVQNNWFVNIRNQTSDVRFLHAVYMNVMSDYNRIVDNLTFRVSGDPIKVRQFSNFNLVQGNTLRCSGGKSFLLDYPESFGPNSGRQDECDSWENRLEHNTLDCGYDGGSLSATFAEPGRQCGAPASWQRFHVSGNTNACTSVCL